MSFEAKVDYVGLSQDGLSLKSNAQNASFSLLEIPGSDGSILGDLSSGAIMAPTCGYSVTGSTTISATLGEVGNTSLDAPYALTRIRITTGAGQEPTVEADAVQLEAGATRSICTYKPTDQTITPARHALTFGAFTYTESTNLVLQNSVYEATCDLTPATIDNVPVASDATGGRETVNATFWSSSETTPPAVTVSTPYHVTTDWSCTGADASLFTWTVTLTHYLTADMAS